MQRQITKEQQVWLIVGLGNPGEEYTETRHNVGFMVLNRLAQRHGLRFDAKQSRARIASGQLGGQRVVLARPFTFMNASGEAVVALRNWYKLDAATQLLLIYDEVDLPFGQLRLRERGSAGTHNGMRSVVGLLGTQNFARLRVGIGKPPAGWDLAGYVLGRFSREEQQRLPEILERAADAVELCISRGVIAAMNSFNSADAP